MGIKENAAGLCMVTFREAKLGYEVERDFREEEGQLLCEMEYIEDKYVYVFTTDPIRPEKYRLAGEYFGLGKGEFAIALIDEYKGEDTRPYSDKAGKYVIIPFIVKGKELEIYACLSRIQLPWSRIEEIKKDPSKRCFKIGNSSGGLCWVPNCVERNLASFSGINDPRIANPGNSVVVIGLFDHLREAERRAEKFRSKLDLFLQRRFDCNEMGESSEEQYRLQMKKYAAGLVLNLIKSNHPHVDRYRAALKNNGRNLENFILEENKKEIVARQEAEKAAYFLARWINDSAGIFEQTLCDYTTTNDNQDHWDMVTEFYCGLLNRFNELSITRKYITDKWDNKESWLNKYLLNENAFQGQRKVTNAVTEFLTAMSTIAYRKIKIEIIKDTIEKVYSTWFRGVQFEIFQLKYMPKDHKFLKSLLANRSEPDFYLNIELSKKCRPFEELGEIADSKVLKNVIVGLETVNLFIAMNQYADTVIANGLQLNKEFTNVTGSLIDFVLAFGKDTLKVGKVPFSFFGAISATIDCGLAFYESTEEAATHDYDAMISKIVAGAGAATTAVGSAMVAVAAYSAAMATVSEGATLATIVSTLWGYGAGATATGIGSPLGTALIFTGVVVFAAGTVAYYFTDDSKTEEWIKGCEWGIEPAWHFTITDVINNQLDVIHSLLYSFTAETWYDPWKKFAGIRIKSPHFQPETKIQIQEIILKGGGKSENIISEPVSIDETNLLPSCTCEVTKGNEIDVIITVAHKTNLSERDSVEAKILVDLFGNGKAILPERNKPVSCKGKIYF
ncbi:MAG TPA: hypothetical protein VHO70_11615 [Chitinispirillaceae bacterium]|nr:hypothetical protein [Chitinispirillaceae bacterium]